MVRIAIFGVKNRDKNRDLVEVENRYRNCDLVGVKNRDENRDLVGVKNRTEGESKCSLPGCNLFSCRFLV